MTFTVCFLYCFTLLVIKSSEKNSLFKYMDSFNNVMIWFIFSMYNIFTSKCYCCCSREIIDKWCSHHTSIAHEQISSNFLCSLLASCTSLSWYRKIYLYHHFYVCIPIPVFSIRNTSINRFMMISLSLFVAIQF